MSTGRKAQSTAQNATHGVETTSQVRCSTVGSLGAVAGVVLKELLLVLESGGDRPLLVNVTLSTVDDRDVAESERDDATSENIDNVCPLVPVDRT